MKEKNYYIYILTNKNNSVLYTGVTGNLHLRIYQHKNKEIEGFTKRYNLNKLIYFEVFDDAHYAIAREKEIKKKKRSKKVMLINSINPNWIDLSKNI